ncbi:MAG: hypothetical protein NXI31_10720 [bacterium]|nr:hypothetical protein [bacterium]
MSLYGSGRREGVLAVVVLGVIVAAVHALDEVATHGIAAFDWQRAAMPAAFGAIGGALFYRFMRALALSRFTAFLAGAGYALAPWFQVMAWLPREQAAAALAPLALEACNRAGRPDQWRRWLPWAGVLVGAPFLAGLTTVACLAVVLAFVQLGRAVVEVDSDDRPKRILGVVGAALAATATAFSLLAFDIGAPWFGESATPSTVAVLAAHRTPVGGLDPAAFVRLPGPLFLLFAIAGVLRSQRRASTPGWLLIACVGATPLALLMCWPEFGELRSTWPLIDAIAAASWWTTLLAVLVLGAAGLDDFLEKPLRYSTCLRVLLVAALAGAPALVAFAVAPKSEWPLALGLVLIPILLVLWRHLGILRFKNVLAAVAILAFAAPALQVLHRYEAPHPMLAGARPLGEVDASRDLVAIALNGFEFPPRDLSETARYSGVCAAGCWGVVAIVLLRRRRQRAQTTPSRAKPPIA